MGNVVRPGSTHYGGSPHGPSFGQAIQNLLAFIFVAPFAFVVRLVRAHGLKAVAAIVFAALFAFAPLTLLYWFCELRLSSVIAPTPGRPVVVKAGRYTDEQERDEPGDTALLQVVCDVPKSDDWEPLLLDDDPARRRDELFDSSYVRREQVYLRRAGETELPFGLLGRPPVSAWLPAGDYEILVVHEAQRGSSYIDARSHTFPLVSTFASCSLEARRKTVVRVALPHYDWSFGPPLQLRNDDGTSAERTPSPEELAPLIAAYESLSAVPTPAGYLLALKEPEVRHTEDHRACIVDMHSATAVPREWTREQLATLRNWLPDDALQARAQLSELVDRLQWREFFQGWFCYAAAGVTGLVFTRWGALKILEPWRRETFGESVWLLIKIFFLSMAAWFAFNVLTNS